MAISVFISLFLHIFGFQTSYTHILSSIVVLDIMNEKKKSQIYYIYIMLITFSLCRQLTLCGLELYFVCVLCFLNIILFIIFILNGSSSQSSCAQDLKCVMLKSLCGCVCVVVRLC